MPLRTTCSSAPHLNVLNEEQVEQIHATTLKVLGEVGLDFPHEEALARFEEAGATVTGSRVRIPAQLLEDALSTAPSSVTLYDRAGNPAMILEGREAHFGTYGTAPYAYDPETGRRGLATSRTIADAARICDYLPNIEWSMPMGVPSDAPVHSADRHQFYHAVTNNTKPVYSSAYTPEGMADAVEMAAVIAGGRDALRERPFFTTGINPSTPLRYAHDVIEKLLVMGRAGLPMIFNSCPMAGATSPATLPGTVVMTVAEGLAASVLAQLVSPGVSVIPGGGPTIMDMKTTVSGMGTPELSLLVAATAQMFRFYGLPSYGTAGGTNAKVVDAQAALEATQSVLMAALAGCNLVHCIGAIDDCMTVSLEAFVLGDEIIAQARRIAGGMAVSDETLAFDVIQAVDIGGHFLDQDHTLEHFREHTYSTMIDRQMYDEWAASGARTMEDRMEEKVRWILNHHQVEPLPEDVIEALDRIVASADDRVT